MPECMPECPRNRQKVCPFILILCLTRRFQLCFPKDREPMLPQESRTRQRIMQSRPFADGGFGGLAKKGLSLYLYLRFSFLVVFNFYV